MIAARVAQLRLALMLLTRLPAGRFDGAPPDMAAARWAFPLAGLPVALIGWGVLAGAAALGMPQGVAGVGALAAMALATGGLHHDGLADLADAAGGRDPAHRLEIMRDSRVGSFGVLALVLTCAMGAAALGALPTDATAGAALMLAAVGSRLAMVGVLAALPPARPDGLGRSARGGAAAGCAGALLAVVLVLLTGPAGIAALIAVAGVAVVVAWRARRTLGGQTGDVLGAVQVCCETVAWVTLSATL